MEKLLRQELSSYTPEWNSKCSIVTDLILMTLCLFIGITLIAFSKKNIEIELDYTNCVPNQEYTQSSNNKVCRIQFKISKKIKAPILVYYKLSNFFLNHRKIIESKNWNELRGEDVDTKSSCKGAYLMSEMFAKNSPYYRNEWGHNFTDNDVASPCGLLARSYFNDTYKLTYNNGTNIYINETGISDQYQKNNFFKRRKDYMTKQWIDVENEHFINWMNIETFSTFKKLWGRIYIDLEPENYYLILNDNYDIAKYDAKKSFVIQNANTFGVSNQIGYFFIGIATYLLLVILVLFVKYFLNKEKKEFNINKLKWD